MNLPILIYTCTIFLPGYVADFFAVCLFLPHRPNGKPGKKSLNQTQPIYQSNTPKHENKTHFSIKRSGNHTASFADEHRPQRAIAGRAPHDRR